jgi:hypothetical protein
MFLAGDEVLFESGILIEEVLVDDFDLPAFLSDLF